MPRHPLARGGFAPSSLHLKALGLWVRALDQTYLAPGKFAEYAAKLVACIEMFVVNAEKFAVMCREVRRKRQKFAACTEQCAGATKIFSGAEMIAECAGNRMRRES